MIKIEITTMQFAVVDLTEININENDELIVQFSSNSEVLFSQIVEDTSMPTKITRQLLNNSSYDVALILNDEEIDTAVLDVPMKFNKPTQIRQAVWDAIESLNLTFNDEPVVLHHDGYFRVQNISDNELLNGNFECLITVENCTLGGDNSLSETIKSQMWKINVGILTQSIHGDEDVSEQIYEVYESIKSGLRNHNLNLNNRGYLGEIDFESQPLFDEARNLTVGMDLEITLTLNTIN